MGLKPICGGGSVGKKRGHLGMKRPPNLSHTQRDCVFLLGIKTVLSMNLIYDFFELDVVM